MHARRAHRPGRAQAPRPHLLPDGHGPGRRRGAAARADHRRGRVQRAVHRGGPDPATRTSSAARARAGRWRSRRSCTSAPAWRSRSRCRSTSLLRELQEQIREAGLADDPVIRQRFAQLYIESQVLRLNAYRGLTATMKRGAPGPEGSLGKWHWAEVNQALTELAMDVAGPRARARRGPVAVPVPARARELDRGRHHRDPQEHRRRARAGTAASMNFDLSDDQRTIKSTAREFLAARYPLGEVRRLALDDERGWTDAQWKEMVDLGWPEIAELGTVEMIVVAEELGYALAPTPLQSTWAARAARRRHRRRAPRRGRGRRPERRRRHRRRARRLGRRRGHRRGGRAGARAGSDAAAGSA